ncbi:hypothetical protein FKW77_004679 [Venturia effusa]|uniref:Uncharacterized protein n=1 Tax=Venturia effusa TaxID=50376 RepID=A0A517LFD3_9PEZI|nr:hypothetical protein FKW77_004679 [Venturia effusa]
MKFTTTLLFFILTLTASARKHELCCCWGWTVCGTQECNYEAADAVVRSSEGRFIKSNREWDKGEKAPLGGPKGWFYAADKTAGDDNFIGGNEAMRLCMKIHLTGKCFCPKDKNSKTMDWKNLPSPGSPGKPPAGHPKRMIMERSANVKARAEAATNWGPLPLKPRASVEFPFIDLLSDNETPFRWVPDMFLTSTNELGINASREYGGEVYPATFEPACDDYAPVPASKDGSTYFKASAANASLTAIFTSVSAQKQDQLPTLFFIKVVNQPVFGDGKFCDGQVRMFNTSLSTGSYAPKAISASIRVVMPTIFTQVPGGRMYWDDATGMQVDTPFIEQNLVPCEGFRGYI